MPSTSGRLAILSSDYDVDAEQWRSRSKKLRSQAERMTYAETESLMLGIADDYARIAGIAEAMADIRRTLDNHFGALSQIARI